MARLPSHKCKRRVGSAIGTWRTTRGVLSPAGSSTGDARHEAHMRRLIGEKTGSRWSLEEAQTRHAGKRSISRKYYFGDHCLRATKRPYTKVTAVISSKAKGGRTPKNRVPPDDSAGESEEITHRYPFRAPTKAWCTPTACWIVRGTSLECMPTRGPASRVV